MLLDLKFWWDGGIVVPLSPARTPITGTPWRAISMSTAPERLKQSTEKRTLSFDFLGGGYGTSTCKLKSGDTVASITSLTADAGVTIGTPSLVGNVVSVQVSGGIHGSTYFVQCNVTTTPSADILELDAIVVIQDHEN